jgi:hypothetical protein
MLKYIALLINSIALLVYHFFFADGITISTKVPESVKPGTEFTVEVTLNKGTVTGFAKFQQDLPEGFTAIQDDNNGASFTFTNQSVKFIWMSLPNDKEFKIKYKVKVADNVSGNQTITGKFSYVTDNVKQNSDVSPVTVNVLGASQPVATNTSPTTTTETTTTTPVENNNKTPEVTTPPANTNSTASTTTTTTTTPESGNTTDNSLTSQLIDKSSEPINQEPSSVTAKRNMPATASGSFNVEIVVNKGNTNGFAKLTENLPEGFTATLIDAQGASFTFADSKVKFVWVSMPTQPEFKISYKVTPAAGATGIKVIDGVFSYIENDDTKKYMIQANSINLGGSASEPVVTNTNTNTNNTATNSTATNNNTTSNTTSATNTTATTNSTASNTTSTQSSNNNMSATSIPAPQGNVNYSVQIAALQNPVSTDKLAARFNINQKINTEMASGFTKYTVGSHNEYKKARDAREQIKSQGVSDAFVTAYSKGKRITVQEALMITSQQWYR